MKRSVKSLIYVGVLALVSLVGWNWFRQRLPGLIVQQTPLRTDTACSGRFVPHDLPHVMGTSVERIGFFNSHGSGLAVNDLDNDGDSDIVLGNLQGPNHIFWNDGDWRFREQVLSEESVQAVTAVDVDGDSWIDIVTTTPNGDVRAWHNKGGGQFAPSRLAGVDAYAYSLDWADLDQDDDLDLVTASYDASLAKQNVAGLEGERAGVTAYQHAEGQFVGTRLIDASQALAVQIVNLNGDGRPDILVGNDFEMPDKVWTAVDGSWIPAQPFVTMALNTTSFALGDVNNDGQTELFVADRQPYANDAGILSQWQPALAAMTANLPEDDVQQMSNALYEWDDGRFHNGATTRGIAATGWSWSSQFGDLDQDGYLDLYVVNGMQALDNFSHLTNDELVEENQAYRNDGQGNFFPMPTWGLNSAFGGRSMVMADLDWDGDLDIVINNLQDPAQIFENQLCQGQNLLVDVRLPDTQNVFAIGTTLILHTSTGNYRRMVQASSGYLSSNPARIHFGFPTDTVLESLEIIWPNGDETLIEDVTRASWIRVEKR